jgi:hypothetical protein
MTEPFLLEQAREFLEPLTARSDFKKSRIAVMHDGTTAPVLDVLARRKYATGWEEDQFPFWVDGNYRNEMLANVGLATKASNGDARRRSAFGVPAGTKEYMKRWRAANRDKMKAAQQRYADKQKRVLEVAAEHASEDPVLARLLRAVTEDEGGE